MLIAFAGLPGTGKSTIAWALARRLGAVYLRVDTLEQAIGGSDGPNGYLAAYAVAEDNLRLGQTVIADSVNAIAITRDAWRDVAARAAVTFAEIEIVCSDKTEHRRRVETRSADIAGHRLPSWQDVVARRYEKWERSPLVIDTAGREVAKLVDDLLNALPESCSARPATRSTR